MVEINQLLKKSEEIFFDCLLPNNCLVAAPTHMPYYPLHAKSYMYCWPGRDLGYCLTGALHLGTDIYEQTIGWIWERAEDFQKAFHEERIGLLIKSYYPNGRIREKEFQADQNGTLLWSIYEHSKIKDLSDVEKKVLKKATKGLIRVWGEGCFDTVVQDLWEEKYVYPQFKDNLTYTLAACSAGLKCSNKLYKNKKASTIAKEMKKLILEGAYSEEEGYFVNRFGGPVHSNDVLDASMLALVWPFEILEPDDKRIISTVEAIEEKLVTKEGIHRYMYDAYEGEVESGNVMYKLGAGAWPLLNFWMSIVQSKMGHKKKAEKYFWMVLEQLDKDLLIPEQLFEIGDPRVGVKPLLWSHMMFVHAAKELGYIENEIF